MRAVSNKKISEHIAEAMEAVEYLRSVCLPDQFAPFYVWAIAKPAGLSKSAVRSALIYLGYSQDPASKIYKQTK